MWQEIGSEVVQYLIDKKISVSFKKEMKKTP